MANNKIKKRLPPFETAPFFYYATLFHFYICSIFARLMQKQHQRVDQLGGFVAFLCAIHCIAIPVLISFGGLGFLSFISHGIVEFTFLIITILFAGSSIFLSLRKNSISKLPVVLFTIGFIGIIFSIIFHLHILSALGGILIASAHFFNWKYTRKISVA